MLFWYIPALILFTKPVLLLILKLDNLFYFDTTYYLILQFIKNSTKREHMYTRFFFPFSYYLGIITQLYIINT